MVVGVYVVVISKAGMSNMRPAGCMQLSLQVHLQPTQTILILLFNGQNCSCGPHENTVGDQRVKRQSKNRGCDANTKFGDHVLEKGTS